MAGKTKAKTPEQKARSVARAIGMPEAQIELGNIRVTEVANHSEDDQRHMVRSGQTRTVRKLARTDALLAAGTIERHHAAACVWYAEAHAQGYDTIGCTANYLGAGGGGTSQIGLLARYKAQAEAREDYQFAKAGIDACLLPLFERVVLAGETMTIAAEGLFDHLRKAQRSSKVATLFRLAANQLHGQIAHRLEVD